MLLFRTQPTTSRCCNQFHLHKASANKVTCTTHLHVHLHELAGIKPGAHGVAVALVGRDEGDERDDAGIREQLGHLPDAPD
eukprot:scaffold315848_cov23-Tisochrysis_lutea.AAC.1